MKQSFHYKSVVLMLVVNWSQREALIMPKVESFNREEVLQKVIEVFWDKGYHGTSMQDLVDASGLNRSSIYNSFGDKQQFFMEALRHYQKQNHNFTISLLKSGQSPKRIIKTILEFGSLGQNESRRKGCLLVNCVSESTQNSLLRDFVVDNMNIMVSFFTELVREGQRLGEFSKDHFPPTLALYFFSCLQGIRTTTLLTDRQDDVNGVIDTILSKA